MREAEEAWGFSCFGPPSFFLWRDKGEGGGSGGRRDEEEGVEGEEEGCIPLFLSVPCRLAGQGWQELWRTEGVEVFDWEGKM